MNFNIKKFLLVLIIGSILINAYLGVKLYEAYAIHASTCDIGLNAGADLQCRRGSFQELVEWERIANASVPSPNSGLSSVFLSNVNGRLYLKNSSGSTSIIAVNGSYKIWTSDAAASVALQGVNIPAARTELDSGIKGTRHNTTFIGMPLGSKYTCYVRFTLVGTTALTLRFSAREVFDSQRDLLCIVIKTHGIVTNTRYFAYNSTWQNLPAWYNPKNFTQTIGIYTEGGNAIMDYVISEFGIIWR